MHRGLWGPQWGPPGPPRPFTGPPPSGRGPWTSACGHILCMAWGAACWCHTPLLLPTPRAWCRRPAGNLQRTPSCRSLRPSARLRHIGNTCLAWQAVPRHLLPSVAWAFAGSARSPAGLSSYHSVSPGCPGVARSTLPARTCPPASFPHSEAWSATLPPRMPAWSSTGMAMSCPAFSLSPRR